MLRVHHLSFVSCRVCAIASHLLCSLKLNHNHYEAPPLMSRTLYLISITVLTLSFIKLWQLIGQYYVLPLIEGLKDGEYTPPLPTVNLHPIERYKPLEFKDLLNGNDSITFKTAEHNPNIVHVHARSTVQSVEDVLRDTWGRSTRNEERDEKTGNLIWSMLECKGASLHTRMVHGGGIRLNVVL